MSHPDYTDAELLNEIKVAQRDKDIERAKSLMMVFSERSLARVKAKVANDVA